MLDDLVKQIEIIDELKNYYIEFGILQEDEYIPIEVNILNTDETISKVEMTVKDIMIFTELGTVMIPGKHILEKVLHLIDYHINNILNEIVSGVFEDDWSKDYLETKLYELEANLQIYIKSIMRSELASSMNTVLGTKDDNLYYYNFYKLEQYIKCKLVKK